MALLPYFVLHESEAAEHVCEIPEAKRRKLVGSSWHACSIWYLIVITLLSSAHFSKCNSLLRHHTVDWVLVPSLQWNKVEGNIGIDVRKGESLDP